MVVQFHRYAIPKLPRPGVLMPTAPIDQRSNDDEQRGEEDDGPGEDGGEAGALDHGLAFSMCRIYARI